VRTFTSVDLGEVFTRQVSKVEYSMNTFWLAVLLLCSECDAYVGAGGLAHVTRPVAMSAVLHLEEPCSTVDLTARWAGEGSGLDVDGTDAIMHASMDEAPKLAHSIAIALDEALESSAGLPVVISEIDSMDLRDACLRALHISESAWGEAVLSRRDFGLLFSGAVYAEDGFTNPADGIDPTVIDAIEVLADELDDQFELRLQASQRVTPVMYGGRVPDGSIVGVLARTRP
jgi:hypothetical protein